MFDFEVRGHHDSKLRLASITPDKHMNFIILPDTFEALNVSLSAEEAKKVRDALIRAYPIEPAKPEPGEYTAGTDYNGKWYVYQNEPAYHQKVVARDLTQDNAKKIAQALNEAEGL